MSEVTTAAQQWQRVKTILADALEQPTPKERTAYLERSCGNDTTLMREVEQLLAQSTRTLEELSDNTPVAFTRLTPALPAGRRIGAYEIVREIGRGGMGAVYLAKRADGQFDKEVAIKLLKRGTDTDEILRRFQVERRILARLDHPNIARLLDAGTTDDGLPYFVMEYVDGVPITDYVRKGQLSVAQRLQLFLKVCEAVQFAHQQRVVHRDLKPGNISVRQDAEPKLLDFGIAKLLASESDAVELTLTAERRFTPVCASPEQARGETVTPASDVYALGALLYEMLTNRPPHRFSTPHPTPVEVAQVIGEQEPIRPSLSIYDNQVRRQLRGDLDNIVLTALRKEPARRYSSVAAFAEDIGRHLEGRAIRARPNTTRYLTGRFVARHKRQIAGFIGVAVAALAFIFLYQSRPTSTFSETNLTSPSPILEKSIAVLPFDNLSDDNGHAYFTDGIQENIQASLAKVADLKVISHASAARYRGPNKNLREIGRALQVAHVLEGTVQKTQSHVRVYARLTDTRNGAQVWAEQYDRTVDDLFAIQNEITGAIVAQLKAALSPQEQALMQEKPTKDMVAYDLYLQAREIERNSFNGMGETTREIVLLDEATKRDPAFVAALCLLARAHLDLYWLNLDHTAIRLELARKALDAAAQSQPDAGEVHLARAVLYYWGSRDYHRALEELAIARGLLPNDPEVLQFTVAIEKRQGHWEEARRVCEEAIALDPLNPASIRDYSRSIYVSMRLYPEANKLLDTLLGWKPNDFGLQRSRAYIDVASKADLGRLQSLVSGESARTADPNLLANTRLELALWRRDYATAERALTDYRLEDSSAGGFVTPRQWFEGIVARGRGDNTAAQNAFALARERVAARIHNRPDDAKAMIMLARIDAALGHKEEAIKEGLHAIELLPVSKDAADGPTIVGAMAAVYAELGEIKAALDLLDSCVAIPNGPDFGSLKLDQEWDSLRSDPRFAHILEESAKRIDTKSSVVVSDKSIAVLPFENLSDDKANSYFAAGIQDELITDLAQVAELKVISRASVAQYTGHAASDVRAIARELGVAHLLSGTVQRSGNRIRVNAQLINARTEEHEWAQQYDRDVSDLFAIQSEIARSIVAQLKARISPNEMNAITQQPTTDLVAYDLYLRANALMEEIATSTDWEGDNRRAIDLLDRAVTHDPKFAAAYANLCDFHLNLYDWVEHTPQRLAQAETAVQEAIRLAPSSAATYLAQADFVARQRQWRQSLEFLRRAQKLQPGNAKLFIRIALAEDHLGQSDDAVRDLEKARELAPRDPNIPNHLDWLYTAIRDYRKSDEVADAAIANFPNGPNYYRAQKVLNALHRGDWKEAGRRLASIPEKFDPSGFRSLLRLEIPFFERDSAEFERLLASVPRNNLIGIMERDVVFMQVLLAEKQGDRAKMESVLNVFRTKIEAELRAEGRDKGPSYHPLQIANLALVHCYLGQMEDALRESEEAIELVPKTMDAMKWPPNAFVRAEVLMRAGQTDRAIDLLEEVAKVPYGPSYGELLGLQWDRLRGDARFAQIVEQLRKKL